MAGMEILDAIGNTSLVRLRRVVPGGCAEVLVKIEWENPTGSLKDRMARAVIGRAEADGRLPPGGTVVEYTGGSTAASLRGVAAVLKRHKPDLRIVAVEPAESAVLGGGTAGPHKIEGVGIRYVPPLWEPSLVDEVVAVATVDAKAMARRLAPEEALCAGTSSAANVAAALRVAERLGPSATVVTLFADSGLKYLSTDVYRQS